MTVSIDIRCDLCRGSRLSVPLHADEETAVECEDCGTELGTLADVKTLVSLKLLGRKKPARPQLMLVR